MTSDIKFGVWMTTLKEDERDKHMQNREFVTGQASICRVNDSVQSQKRVPRTGYSVGKFSISDLHGYPSRTP